MATMAAYDSGQQMEQKVVRFTRHSFATFFLLASGHRPLGSKFPGLLLRGLAAKLSWTWACELCEFLISHAD
jgi:hypothetical protein